MRLFNRLYVKVYLTIVATLVLVIAVSAAVWRAGPEVETARNAFQMATGVATAALADPAAPQDEQQKAVDRLARLLNADLALYSEDGRLIGTHGATLPPPDEVRDSDGRWFQPRRNPVWNFSLPDGRQIVLRPPFEHHRGGGIGFFGHLALVALLLALGSYPIVRGLTRRLERLQQGVESLGAGDLTARVKVEGKDEVAGVAASFNRAAERIEELVKAHKMLLANASHELRTPLTRLRMSVELLKEKADPARRAELEQDIAELNHLIDEILLSSRLDAMQRLDTLEDVDLLALAAEEAAHYDAATVSGAPVTLRGDARLLRRLLRNLLENAAHHGAPPVDVTVEAQGRSAKLTVADHGQGVAEADREHIFEPFFRSTSGTAQGTGLGLAIVRQIARRHGGEATVSGAAFTVALPLAPQ